MTSAVGVVFRNSGKLYHFGVGDLEIKIGDNVIVETVRGSEIARVVTPVKELHESEIMGELKPIVRLATPDDLIVKYRNRLLSYRALKICKKKVRHHNLDMKLVDVEYSLDGSKIVFYFSAEGRIDFRNLVRELAAIFKRRIELHQIGVRDEAKILGGIGPCGRAVCCNSFMPEFAPVSIKMAKEQNLSLNPERISGSCGRFMCCLKHEHDIYQAALKTYPPLNSMILTPYGEAKVIEHYIAKGALLLENQSKGRFELKITEINKSPEELSLEKGTVAEKPVEAVPVIASQETEPVEKPHSFSAAVPAEKNKPFRKERENRNRPTNKNRNFHSYEPQTQKTSGPVSEGAVLNERSYSANFKHKKDQGKTPQNPDASFAGKEKQPAGSSTQTENVKKNYNKKRSRHRRSDRNFSHKPAPSEGGPA